MPSRAPDRARFGWTLWGWTRAGSGAGLSRRRGGAYPAQVPREPARGGTLGRVLLRLRKIGDYYISYFLFSARGRNGRRRAPEVQRLRRSHNDRRSRPLHHPRHPAITLRHEFNHGMQRDKVRGHEAKHNAVLATGPVLTVGAPSFVTTSTPLWCGFQDQESAESYQPSVERQSRGRPHGGAPQRRGDRAHSRGARRPHGHWLWSFPRVLRRDRLPESQELARVF